MNILDMKPRKFMDFWKYTEIDNIIAATTTGTYELDGVSSKVWELCDGETEISQIISKIASLYNMEDNIDLIENDIINLLQQWQYNELIIFNYNPLHAFSEYKEDILYEYSIDEDIDILLIAPPSPNPTTGMNIKVQGTFPLGIGYISSYLKKFGYKVGVLNLWITETNEKSIEYLISRLHPKILGISVMTDNFLNGVTISKIAKKVNKDIVIIFGGPHVTFSDSETLLNYPEIDLIVRNEGEITTLELANYYIKGIGTLNDILGITYRNGEEIIRNKVRKLIKNLDELPLPDRANLDFTRSMIGIQTSRGCPGACIFCVATTMAGGYYRVRSAENVVDEIENLYNQGARNFFFQDDTVTADTTRLNEILNVLEERNLSINWSAESRVDVVDKEPDIFKRMAKAGCTNVQFGVESGSQYALDNLRKNISVDQIFRAIDAAKEAGLQAVCTMLVGHPFDTKESVNDTFEFAKKLIDLDAFVLFSIVTPYPGSEIRARKEKYGIKIHDTSYNNYFVSNAIIDTEFLTAKEIRNLYYDGMRNIIYANLRKDEEGFTKKFMNR